MGHSIGCVWHGSKLASKSEPPDKFAMTQFLQTIPNTAEGASSHNNRGLFTLVDVQKGQILCHLGGDVVPHNDDMALLERAEWNAIDDLHIQVRHAQTSYFLINHSLQPNLTIDPDTFALSAKRDIAKGEELLLDYLENGFPQEYLQTDRCAYLR